MSTYLRYKHFLMRMFCLVLLQVCSTHAFASVHVPVSYDANGNLIRWQERSFHDDEVQQHWRTIVWDEENRVRSILDGHSKIDSDSSEEDKHAAEVYKEEHVQRYIYDDSGERVIKYGHGEDVVAYGEKGSEPFSYAGFLL